MKLSITLAKQNSWQRCHKITDIVTHFKIEWFRKRWLIYLGKIFVEAETKTLLQNKITENVCFKCYLFGIHLFHLL